MAFITRCLKNGWADRAVRWLLVCCCWLVCAVAQAQPPLEGSQLRAERVDDEILVSAQVPFELPAAVEDALQKGVPLYFVVEAEILKARWYWWDKKIIGAERQLRLAYQPLTRRWRLTVTSGTTKSGSLGLALNQYFDTLPQALAIVQRVSRWQIADVAELDPAVKYRVEFRFKLDLTQLPLPFQIGAMGQSDWDVSLVLAAPLSLDPGK